MTIFGLFALNRTGSTIKLATVTGVPQNSPQRILKTHKFHSYKISLTQELSEDSKWVLFFNANVSRHNDG